MKKNRYVLSYDLAALPKDMTIKEVQDKIINEGVVLYNTAGAFNNSGRNVDFKPVILDLGEGEYENNSKPDLKFTDQSQQA